MKKIINSLLTLCCLLCPSTLNAYDFMVDGIAYNINSDGTSVTVTYQNYSYSSNSSTYTNLSGDLVFPKDVTSGNVTYSVTAIGSYAFSYCEGITSVTIPNSVTSICDDAFKYCSSLTRITIPNSVTTIGNRAFFGCTGITSVFIPSSVSSIGKINPFARCNSLRTIVVESGNTIYDSRNNCNAIIETATNTLIASCKNTIIPNSVTSIGDGAFWGRDDLTSLTIFDSVTSIGDAAFAGCTSLTNITIPNSVTSVGNWAFWNCSGLTSVTIPNSVTSIGNNAFYGCFRLNYIYCDIQNPNQVILGYNVFSSVPKQTCILHVPSGTKEMYENAEQWKDFNIIVDYTGIALNKTFTSIYVDGTETLVASTIPDDVIINSLTWTSSNPNVATVDLDGLVTAKALGTAIITATTTDGTNLSASCEVLITGITDITLNKTSTNIYVGGVETLIATFIPSDVINKTLTWTSGNSNIATVNQNGKVMAKTLGTTTITVRTTDGTNLSDSCVVTVNGITSITLNENSMDVYVGKTETLIATITPSDVVNKTLIWTSSNPDIATVDQNGIVTAKLVGSATITATTTDGTNLSASCLVTVIGITEIMVNKTATSIFVGDSETLTATVLPSDVILNTILWSSSNPSIASVDQSGKVTAKKKGVVNITATATDGTGISASCEVTVLPTYEISGEDITHLRGVEKSYDLPISLINKEPITAIQFILELPEGLTLATNNYGEYNVWLDNDRKARNHSVSVEPIEEYNHYLVVVSSPTNRTFSGHSGPILHLHIMAQYHEAIGDYFIKYTNIVAAEADETQHFPSSVHSKVRLSYLVGDANADAGVDVADYVCTANYLLGRDTGPHFYFDAANAAYNDNVINVTDLVAITNIGLEIREKEYWPDINDYQFALAPVEIMPGTDYTLNARVSEKSANQTIVSIAVDNDEPLAAMQFDIDLPEGITLVAADVTNRSRGLSASCGTSPEGKARVILSSFGDADIESGTGDVLTLTLQGNTHNGDLLRVTDIVMAERNLIEHGSTSELSLDLNTVTGVNEVSYDMVNIYGRDGAVIIESPVNGMAQIVRVNGIYETVIVKPGCNVYPMNVTYADIVIVIFNGNTAKLQF